MTLKNTLKNTSKNELMEQIGATVGVVPGWCSKQKAAYLANAVIQYKPALVVELGVFAGSSLIPMAMALKYNGYGKIVGIDPWDNAVAQEGMIEEANLDWWGKVNMNKAYNDCLSFVNFYSLQNHVTLKKGRSEDFTNDYTNIDILHVDGNHSMETALQDVTMWLPKTKVGGMVLLDDVNWTEGGQNTTKPAIDYVLERCREIDVVSDCLIAIKEK